MRDWGFSSQSACVGVFGATKLVTGSITTVVWSRVGNTVRNPQSGKCLDASGNSPADGTRLNIWTCTGGANQNWQL